MGTRHAWGPFGSARKVDQVDRYILLTFAARREGPWYVAECVELGTSSFGASEDEAFAALHEATLLYLNTLEELGEASDVLQARGVTVHQGSAGKEMPRCTDATIRSQVIPLPITAAA